MPPTASARKRTAPRIGHRKSRGGCIHCKRRKVKCDEVKPECANCVRFELECIYTNRAGNTPISAQQKILHVVAHSSTKPQASSLPARGRGRPRKDWAASHESAALVDENSLIACSSELASLVSPGREPENGSDEHSELNLAQAELLHHWTICTGPSLTDRPQDHISLFWSQNAPRIGLTYTFVLYLALSLAAYQLAHSSKDDPGAKARYLSLGKYHFSLGLGGLSKALPDLDDASCGPIYLSTMLMGMCTLAAGPNGPDDLLVCDVSRNRPGKWLPIARGVRIVHEISNPEALCAGLMESFRREVGDEKYQRPRCEREKFPRLEWISPLESLHAYIHTHVTHQIFDSRLASLETIKRLYEATYGCDNGSHETSFADEAILRWLYVMDDSFVAFLQARDPLALLVLAYYAPLLSTMWKSWFMEGWGNHLLAAVEAQLNDSYTQWLEWPERAVQLTEDALREI